MSLPLVSLKKYAETLVTITSFLLTFLDLYVKFPGTPETIKE